MQSDASLQDKSGKDITKYVESPMQHVPIRDDVLQSLSNGLLQVMFRVCPHFAAT